MKLIIKNTYPIKDYLGITIANPQLEKVFGLVTTFLANNSADLTDLTLIK